MQILSVTMKNFKVHRDRHFTFQLGTNAICGENGAGKTSIVEAIAWTLFNYRGDYRKEDLIHNGEGSAQTTVSFVSSCDGRTYDVQRCTSKGYTIYDPQLNHRLPYTRIDEDVLPWLRQQMGVSPSADLGRLFANTIGVPQGTFTADFLLSAEKRKHVFDSILKVEEFRQVYTQLGSLKKYSEGLVEGLKREIHQYDELLTERDSIQQGRDRVRCEIDKNQASLKTLESEQVILQEKKDCLEGQAQQVQNLENSIKRTQLEFDAKQRELGGQQNSITQAQEAVQQCKLHQPGYDAYLKAEERLKSLEDQGKQHRAVLKKRDVKQKEQSGVEIELAKLSSQLNGIRHAQREIERLNPLVQRQHTLENQKAEAQKTLQHLKQCEIERHNLEQQVNLYRGEWKNLAQDIARIRSLEGNVARVSEWEHQRDRLQSQLSRIDAAQQFEQELHQIVTHGEEKRDRHHVDTQVALKTLQEVKTFIPAQSSESFQQVLDTIEMGRTLNTNLLESISEILKDLRQQISAPTIKIQLKSIKKQLDLAYRAQAEIQTLEVKQTRQNEIQAEAEQFQSRMKELSITVEQEPIVLSHLEELSEELQTLNNPHGQVQIRQKELESLPTLESAFAEYQQKQTTIQAAIAQLEEKLEPFADLDLHIESAQQNRQNHQASYQVVLQNQPIATQLPVMQEQFKRIQVELHHLSENRDQLQTSYEEVIQDYDPDIWKQIEKAYADTRSRADQIRGSLPEQQKRLDDYEARLKALDELSEKRDQTRADLKSKERVKRFVNFSRKVFKDAGPRITERYVQVISKEADRLFRELLNRQNVMLTWTRDYEVIVQEGAHSRRFINLSGGEQMCAALAVRLALLRVLADIDIAFFDEPTTNMDRPRRASLAEAIANIKSFQQLFVISHDDTFEQFTENLVLVERDP